MSFRQCNNCGGFPSVSGEGLALEAHTCPHGLWCELDGCEKCIAVDWKSHPMRVLLSRDERLARARGRMSRLRAERKAKGMCIDCGRKAGKYQCCAECAELRSSAVAPNEPRVELTEAELAEKHRERSRLFMQKLRSERRANGECVDCGDKLDNGNRRCAKCAANK